jgi:hypothetical protein
MRVETKNCSFLRTVRKFLPRIKEKCKKAHVSSEKQVNFLEKKKCELRELLSYAKYNQKVGEKEKKRLYSEIRKLRKPVRYTTLGIREMLLYKRKLKIAKVKRALDSLKNTIKKLETAEKKMIDNPQEFLRENGILPKC